MTQVELAAAAAAMLAELPSTGHAERVLRTADRKPVYLSLLRRHDRMQLLIAIGTATPASRMPSASPLTSAWAKRPMLAPSRPGCRRRTAARSQFAASPSLGPRLPATDPFAADLQGLVMNHQLVTTAGEVAGIGHQGCWTPATEMASSLSSCRGSSCASSWRRSWKRPRPLSSTKQSWPRCGRRRSTSG